MERFGIAFVMAKWHVMVGTGKDSCSNISECLSFPVSLSFWVELVGAYNSIRYQSGMSRVQILVRCN